MAGCGLSPLCALASYAPLIPLLWIAAVVGASCMYRWTRNKPLLPRAPASAIFMERSGSGRALDAWWRRIGGANNCLCVVLTDRSLHIYPMFPFNLMFLPEVYGLEYEIPLDRILRMTQRRAWWGRLIRIDWRDDMGQTRAIELRLRKLDDFARAWATLAVARDVPIRTSN